MAMSIDVEAGGAHVYLKVAGQYSPDVLDDLRARAADLLNDATQIAAHADHLRSNLNQPDTDDEETDAA